MALYFGICDSLLLPADLRDSVAAHLVNALQAVLAAAFEWDIQRISVGH